MATSSILESVRLTSPKAASMFVDALEESASMPRKTPFEYKYHVEKFVRNSCIEFYKRKMSVTYLVNDEDDRLAGISL